MDFWWRPTQTLDTTLDDLEHDLEDLEVLQQQERDRSFSSYESGEHRHNGHSSDHSTDMRSDDMDDPPHHVTVDNPSHGHSTDHDEPNHHDDPSNHHFNDYFKSQGEPSLVSQDAHLAPSHYFDQPHPIHDNAHVDPVTYQQGIDLVDTNHQLATDSGGTSSQLFQADFHPHVTAAMPQVEQPVKQLDEDTLVARPFPEQDDRIGRGLDNLTQYLDNNISMTRTVLSGISLVAAAYFVRRSGLARRVTGKMLNRGKSYAYDLEAPRRLRGHVVHMAPARDDEFRRSIVHFYHVPTLLSWFGWNRSKISLEDHCIPVRLAGIKLHDSDQAFERLQSLLRDQRVFCQPIGLAQEERGAQAQADRALMPVRPADAFLWPRPQQSWILRDACIATVLLREGHATTRGYSVPSSQCVKDMYPKVAKRLESAEQGARRRRLGMWADTPHTISSRATDLSSKVGEVVAEGGLAVLAKVGDAASEGLWQLYNAVKARVVLARQARKERKERAAAAKAAELKATAGETTDQTTNDATEPTGAETNASTQAVRETTLAEEERDATVVKGKLSPRGGNVEADSPSR